MIVKWILGVVISLTLLIITAAIGGYQDVQTLKSDMTEVQEKVKVGKKNNKLLCKMALKVNLKKMDIEEFCVRED